MGFDQGNMTFRICRLGSELPANLVDAFYQDRAGSLDNVMEEPQWGWVTARHLLDTNITEETVKLAGFYHLCLRVAERKVPSSLLKAECRLQELGRLQADGKQYLSKQERKQIKEEVMQKLLPNMPPSIQGSFFVIDPAEKLVFTTATSKHAMEIFQANFQKTTKVEPVPLDPQEAAERLFGIDPASVPSFSISPTRETPDGEENGTLGCNFLTWLWYVQEMRGGVSHQGKNGDFSFMLDGPLTFVSEGEGAFESVMRKGKPTLSAEAKAALMAGKKLKSAKLILARDQNEEWSCQLDAENFIIRGLKLPEQEAMDPISIFEERMTNLYLFHKVLFGLYGEFLHEMCDAKLRDEYREKAKEWISAREEY